MQNQQPQNQNQQKSGLSWSTPSTNNSAPKSSTPVPAPVQKTLSIPASQSNMAGYVGMLAGGIVIGVLLAWGYSAIRGDSTTAAVSNSNGSGVSTTSSGTKTATTKTSTTAGTNAATSNSDVAVTSPQTAGMNVAVKVAVSKPTWVVVYDNVNGKPGNALGAHLFFSNGSGTVTLLRATKSGMTYFVGTSVDNGDKKFAKATDKAAINSDGSLSVVTFEAQ